MPRSSAADGPRDPRRGRPQQGRASRPGGDDGHPEGRPGTGRSGGAGGTGRSGTGAGGGRGGPAGRGARDGGGDRDVRRGGESGSGARGRPDERRGASRGRSTDDQHGSERSGRGPVVATNVDEITEAISGGPSPGDVIETIARRRADGRRRASGTRGVPGSSPPGGRRAGAGRSAAGDDRRDRGARGRDGGTRRDGEPPRRSESAAERRARELRQRGKGEARRGVEPTAPDRVREEWIDDGAVDDVAEGLRSAAGAATERARAHADDPAQRRRSRSEIDPEVRAELAELAGDSAARACPSASPRRPMPSTASDSTKPAASRGRSPRRFRRLLRRTSCTGSRATASVGTETRRGRSARLVTSISIPRSCRSSPTATVPCNAGPVSRTCGARSASCRRPMR